MTSTSSDSSPSGQAGSPTNSSNAVNASAVIVVTAAEAQNLEAERQEKAAAAVAQIHAVEESNVLDAIASLNDTNSTEVTLSTDLGPMKVNLLKKDQVEAAGRPFVVRVENGVVELPTESVSEVLTSAGLNSDSIVLSVLKVNEENSSSLETDAVYGDASLLSSPVLSINFWRSDGTRVEVKNLAKPLYFTLEVSDPTTAKCGFWDEETGKWSEDGLRVVCSKNKLECSTAHLTIFGAITDVFLKNVVLALTCSTISSLLSGEAFERLPDPAWLGSPPFILNIVFHMFGVVCTVLAWLHDRKQERLFPWAAREVVLLRVKEEEEGEAYRVTEIEAADVPTSSCWSRCLGCCNYSLEYVSHAAGGDATLEALKEVVGNADSEPCHFNHPITQSWHCSVANFRLQPDQH